MVCVAGVCVCCRLLARYEKRGRRECCRFLTRYEKRGGGVGVLSASGPIRKEGGGGGGGGSLIGEPRI